MLRKRKDCNILMNSDKCVAYEYKLGDKDIDSTYIEIKGSYPEKGRVVNKICKEVVFIADGSGKVVVEGKEYNLEKHDSCLILNNQRYYFDGNLKILTVCTPAWYPEQHKECE